MTTIAVSTLGWGTFLLIQFYSDNMVLAAIIGATAVAHIKYLIKQMITTDKKQSPKQMEQWTVESIDCEQDGPNEWEITEFKPIGYMYFREWNPEMVLQLLHETGAIADGYDSDDYRVSDNEEVIYVTKRLSGRPLFRLGLI